MILHFLGFAAFLGPVVIIELPVAIIELVNMVGEGSDSEEGEQWLKISRMILIIMRILCTSFRALTEMTLSMWLVVMINIDKLRLMKVNYG